MRRTMMTVGIVAVLAACNSVQPPRDEPDASADTGRTDVAESDAGDAGAQTGDAGDGGTMMNADVPPGMDVIDVATVDAPDVATIDTAMAPDVPTPPDMVMAPDIIDVVTPLDVPIDRPLTDVPDVPDVPVGPTTPARVSGSFVGGGVSVSGGGVQLTGAFHWGASVQGSGGGFQLQGRIW